MEKCPWKLQGGPIIPILELGADEELLPPGRAAEHCDNPGQGIGMREEESLLPFLLHPTGRWRRPGKGWGWEQCLQPAGRAGTVHGCYSNPHIPGARIAEEFRLRVGSAEHRLTAGMHQFLNSISG